MNNSSLPILSMGDDEERARFLEELDGSILFRIVRHFPLRDLLAFRLTCRKIHENIENHVEEGYYKFYIEHVLFGMHLHQFTTDQYGTQLKIIEKLENCRNLLKEFMERPFTDTKYENDVDFKKYLGLGGVVRISLFKPCELLNRMMKQLHESECERFKKVPFHKFLLISSIFPLLECSGINIKKPEFWEDSPIDECKVSPGQLLIWMCNRPVHPQDLECDGESDEEEIYMDGEYVSSSSDDEENDWESIENLQYNPPCEIHLRLKDEDLNPYGEKTLKYHLLSNKPHEERVEDYKMCDIFTFCSRPPSSSYVRKGHEQDLEKMIRKLRSYIYNDFRQVYTFDWSGTISRNKCWSVFWQRGLEWWGCFAFTTYNAEKGVFVVTTASESD